jgi:D-alanine-D-alanine ligase
MSRVSVLILYNDPVLPPGHPDFDSEHDVLQTVEMVGAALADRGFTIDRLGLKRDPGRLLARLADGRPDVVFNLFEGLADHGQTEGYVAGLLDWSGVRFTGCPSEALCIARSKHLAKYVLRGAGLPTAAFMAIAEVPVPRCSLAWPVIIKPALEDGSIGLDQGSVVTDQASFQARVQYLLNTYGPPVLVEEFVDGREFNVAVIETPGRRAHVVSEIAFQDHPAGHWRIVTYNAKWKTDSREFQSTPARCPATLSSRENAHLTGLANQAFDLFACRDYARIDFRVDASGKTYVIEVNPNPDLGPDAGLARGLASIGLTYNQFVVQLVENALERQPAEKA